MNIQGKVWGETQQLFMKNNVEIHRIEAKKGGYCSKHKHDSKYNAFFVESGKLKISVWKNDYNLVDCTTIISKQMSIVKPKEYHMFEALEDTIAYEIYWTEIDANDIIRKQEGGIKSDRYSNTDINEN